MGEIIVSSSGNGIAYVNNPSPSENERVTLYAIPNSGATLDDIIATDSHGASIALYVQQEQTFTYRSSWGTMFISVVFSGSGPTPPTPTIPYWLLFKMRKKHKRRYV